MDTNIRSEIGWQSIIDRLGQHIDIESSAAEYTALRRKRAVRSASDLLRLCFAYVLCRLSLRMLSAWAQAEGLAACSVVAMLKRLRGSAYWLEALVHQLMAASFPTLLARTTPHAPVQRLLLVDGSMLGSVRDGPTARRMHVVYDLQRQRPLHVIHTDCHTAERLDIGDIMPGDIRIADRGFARHRDISSVISQGGDFIVRTGSRHLCLFNGDNPQQRLDVESICAQARANEKPQDVAIVIAKGGRAKDKPAPVSARLIVAPLPQTKVAAAQDRARKNARTWQYKATEKTLAMAGYVLLITSLPEETWPAERVLAAYRLRWQIELMFKRWKSLIGLDQLRVSDPQMIRCWIAIVLLTTLLVDQDRPDIQADAPDSPPFAA
jgi:Transposase DDE domain